VSKRVVDHLEQIEVEHEDREPIAMTLEAGNGLFHFLQQHGAIGEACQAVVAGHVGDLRLGSLLRRNVVMDANPSAVRHRAVIDRERASVAHGDFAIVRLASANVGQALLDVRAAVLRAVTPRNASVQDGPQRHAGRRLFG
jgi:hypothetical protein